MLLIKGFQSTAKQLNVEIRCKSQHNEKKMVDLKKKDCLH